MLQRGMDIRLQAAGTWRWIQKINVVWLDLVQNLLEA